MEPRAGRGTCTLVDVRVRLWKSVVCTASMPMLPARHVHGAVVLFRFETREIRTGFLGRRHVYLFSVRTRSASGAEAIRIRRCCTAFGQRRVRDVGAVQTSFNQMSRLCTYDSCNEPLGLYASSPGDFPASRPGASAIWVLQHQQRRRPDAISDRGQIHDTPYRYR